MGIVVSGRFPIITGVKVSNTEVTPPGGENLVVDYGFITITPTATVDGGMVTQAATETMDYGYIAN